MEKSHNYTLLLFCLASGSHYPGNVSGSDNSKAIHKTMEASKSKSKIVIMFDNIKQLELSNLDIGHSATDNNKRDTVTSILIRFGKI